MQPTNVERFPYTIWSGEALAVNSCPNGIGFGSKAMMRPSSRMASWRFNIHVAMYPAMPL
jgi:hypothetical protein